MVFETNKKTGRDTLIDKILMIAGLNSLDTDTLKLREVYLFQILGGLIKLDWNVNNFFSGVSYIYAFYFHLKDTCLLIIKKKTK